MIFKPGKVTIKVLPRIDSSEYSKENIDELVSHTRLQDKVTGNIFKQFIKFLQKRHDWKSEGDQQDKIGMNWDSKQHKYIFIFL